MNQLSNKEEQIIKDVLTSKNSEIIVKHIIKEYANQSVLNASKLIDYISEVTSILINICANKINKYAIASTMLLLNNDIDKKTDGKYKKSEDYLKTKFATIVPVCLALFPDGLPENGSELEKNYFMEFITLLENKKAFDWDRDSTWLNVHNYYDYVNKMYDIYINKKKN